MIIQRRWFVRETPVVESRICWSWSIQPLVIWIRILGVDIPDFPMDRSRRHRWFNFIYSTLCFLAHLVCQVDVLYILYWQRRQASLENKREFESTTDSWNLIFDYVNYTVYAIIGHLILLTVIRPKWIAMMECFQQTQFFFNEEHYIRIRTFSLRSVAFSVLIVIGLTVTTTSYNLHNGTQKAHHTWISAISTLLTLYPMTAVLVFIILSYASTLTFQIFQTEINHSVVQLNNRNNLLNIGGLLIFKRRHFINCDSVDVINNISGSTLFLSTLCFSLSVINSSFYTFDPKDVTKFSFTPDALFLVYAVFNLTWICFTADLIRNKAFDVIRELMNLTCNQLLTRTQNEQLKWLINEMGLRVPQVKANGFFNVSKKLIPQLIGTAVTYVLILYQFKLLEI